jgi:dephospho-CoA kinase
VAPDGSMDRSAMRQLAFDDPQARRRLEAILHPLIREQTDADVRAAIEAGAPYVLVAVPLLVESGQAQGRFDRVLVVDCPPEVQVERVMRRSGLARSQVQAILGAQASREARLAVADDVVDNGGDEAGLAPQVDAIHRLYLGLSR